MCFFVHKQTWIVVLPYTYGYHVVFFLHVIRVLLALELQLDFGSSARGSDTLHSGGKKLARRVQPGQDCGQKQHCSRSGIFLVEYCHF